MGLFDWMRPSGTDSDEPAVTKNSILIDLSESEKTDFGRVDFAAQPPDQQVFSAIWELEGGVNSEGFESYLATGDKSIEFAPIALEKIGATKAAAIVRRALALPPQDSNDLTDEQLEQLEELDQEFMAYPDDLTALLYQFVVERPETFGPVPEATT